MQNLHLLMQNQIINAANKTSNEETNTKINNVKSDLSGEIKKVDDKLNILSMKVPFRVRVASIHTTDSGEKLGKYRLLLLHKNRLIIFK